MMLYSPSVTSLNKRLLALTSLALLMAIPATVQASIPAPQAIALNGASLSPKTIRY